MPHKDPETALASARAWKAANKDRNREINRRAQVAYMSRISEERKESLRRQVREYKKMHADEIRQYNQKYCKAYYMKKKQAKVLAWWVIPGIKRDLIPTENQALRIELVADIVSSYYGIKTEDMRSKVKKRKFVLPRQITMSLMKKFSPWNLNTIGEYFEGRNGKTKDHSTVIHAIKTVKDLCDSDPVIRGDVMFLEQKLQKRNLISA